MNDLKVDYLVRGAGAAGMAFTDALVAGSNATVVIVDRNHRPGGHWNVIPVCTLAPAIGVLRGQLPAARIWRKGYDGS